MLNHVTLIDLSSIYWAAWHSSANDHISAATERTINGVKRAAGNGLVAICCDEGKSWRKGVSPEYKANRPEKDHAAVAELDRVKARLRQDGYLLWGESGYEADDIIATAAAKALAEGLTVTIASADKDLLQLVSDNVSALSTNSWATLGPAEVEAKFGVKPSQMRDYLALVGDSSDNIKGIRGIGQKTAAELLRRFNSIEKILAALDADEKTVGTPAIVKGLKDGRDGLAMARMLIALKFDAPIAFDELYQEREPAPLVERTDNVAELDGQEHNEIDADAEPTAKLPEPEKAPAPVTALAVRPASFEMGLEPTSLGTAYKLAEGLHNSRLYNRFPNPEAIWAVVIRGREMGLGALTALDCFHVIEGKPAPHAHLIIARAKAHPDCEYFQFIAGDSTFAEYETKNRRNPKPTRLRYTIEQAQQAGLAGRGGNWKSRPDEMLRKTCAVQLARIEYPDATLGLYAAEELGEAA